MDISEATDTRSSALQADSTTQLQTNGEKIDSDNDSDSGDNDLLHSIKRARIKTGKEADSSPSGQVPRRLTALFTLEDCKTLSLRKKEKTVTPAPSLASSVAPTVSPGINGSSSLPFSIRGQSKASQGPKPGVTSNSHSSPSTALYIEDDDEDLGPQQRNKHRSSNNRATPSVHSSSSSSTRTPTDRPKIRDSIASLQRKRPYQSLSQDTDKPRVPNGTYKKARPNTTSSTSGVLRAPRPKTVPRPGPGPTARDAVSTYDNDEGPSRAPKLGGQAGRSTLDDIDLFKQFEANVLSTKPAQIVPWQALDAKAVRKATENAPNRQEHNRTEYRKRARNVRAEQIKDNIIRNQRKEHPNKSDEAIRQDASARVDAWKRDRQEADKRQKQLDLNAARLRKQQDVTNLSAPASDFLSPARLVTVYTVYRSNPSEGSLNEVELRDKLFRHDTYTTAERANKEATEILTGGSVAALARREISSQLEAGLLKGSAKLADGRKFICFVEKENKQAGKLPPQLIQGKKVREDAIKPFRTKFEVLSVCVRPADTPDEEGDSSERVINGSSGSQEQEQVIAAESVTSEGTTAIATFPEGSVNPAGHIRHDYKNHGGYTTRAFANQKAFQVMRELWRSRTQRMGPWLYYRDTLEPRIRLHEEQGDWDTHNIKLHFNPDLHEKGYDYLSSSV